MRASNLVGRLVLPELELTASWYRPAQRTSHLGGPEKAEPRSVVQKQLCFRALPKQGVRDSNPWGRVMQSLDENVAFRRRSSPFLWAPS
jgi:hypothetical protein